MKTLTRSALCLDVRRAGRTMQGLLEHPMQIPVLTRIELAIYPQFHAIRRRLDEIIAFNVMSIPPAAFDALTIRMQTERAVELRPSAAFIERQRLVGQP